MPEKPKEKAQAWLSISLTKHIKFAKKKSKKIKIKGKLCKKKKKKKTIYNTLQRAFAKSNLE